MLLLKNISFSYDVDEVIQLDRLQVDKGETLAIIGESGSGKSTLLKLIYGQYDLDNGNIYWNESPILGPAYNLVVGYDYMKYVAQEFDLMPFTTVAENIGQFLSNFYSKEKQKRTEELLETVELIEFANTKVQFLSGGQKQRVALARALAKEPEIILLDEPFSHIDNFKKRSLRRNIFSYLKRKQITCIVATHDNEDILGFADNMLVLHKGKQLAYGTPQQLYKKPEHRLIASFFGEFNVIDGTIVYAHQLKVVEQSDLKAIVKQCYFKGNHYLIQAKIDQRKVFFNHSVSLEIDSQVCLEILE